MYYNSKFALIDHPSSYTRPPRSSLAFSVLLFFSLVWLSLFAIKKYVGRTQDFSFVTPKTENYITEYAQTKAKIIVKKGDTISSILAGQGLSQSDIGQILKLAVVKSTALKIGQKILFDYEINIIESEDSDLTSETRTLRRIVINLDNINSVEILRNKETFTTKTTSVPLTKYLMKSSTVIDKSVMTTLKSLGLGTASIIELVNAYSYQVDFQRQVQKGDRISIIAEKFVTESGQFSHHGKVLFASLKLADKEYNIYRYSRSDKKLIKDDFHGFFSEEGKSVKRSLLRTPVNLVRISSHYGNRVHPISGFTKMHKGVDFAAPEGTPIYAAGEGVITELGRKSGYGKFIQIKHSANLSTAYAHASNFAKNLRVGSRVKQGQVIAYVGRTGRATAAHLHYEVKVGGKHVNPIKIRTTPGIEFTGEQLVQFQKFKNRIKSLSTKLDSEDKILAPTNNIAAL